MFLFFGAHAFSFTDRIYLFDSANPAHYVMHPGRLVSSLCVIWVAGLFAAFDRHMNLLRGVVAVILGIGISAMTISVAALSAAASLVFLLFSPQPRRLTCAAILAFLAVALIYRTHESVASWGGVALVVAIGAVSLVLLRKPEIGGNRGFLVLGGCVLAGLGCGLTVGNLTALSPDVLAAQGFLETGDDLLAGGRHAVTEWPAVHQYDLSHFALKFGLPLVLLALFVVTRPAREDVLVTSAAGAIVLFMDGLLLMDFVLIADHYETPKWSYVQQFALRSRFVEGGFYALLGLSLAGLVRSEWLPLRVAATAYVGLATITPIVWGELSLLTQWWYNARFLSRGVSAF
ncbi:MAG TPA: hypothetical protein VGN97_05995 [Mesorhizobium sp.]|jgi:hypothetical protein|nr:hypothetical protein [Mesorhizobium sp.]